MQTAEAAPPQILLVGRPSLRKTLHRDEFSKIRERIGTELTLGKSAPGEGAVPDRRNRLRIRRQTAGLALAALASGAILFAANSQPSSPGHAQAPALVMAPLAMQPRGAENDTPPQSLVAGEEEPEPAR
jgi:hypothetical protein